MACFYEVLNVDDDRLNEFDLVILETNESVTFQESVRSGYVDVGDVICVRFNGDPDGGYTIAFCKTLSSGMPIALYGVVDREIVDIMIGRDLLDKGVGRDNERYKTA